jgi:hypothetical protein
MKRLFFIVLLNYLQFHRIQNSSGKPCGIHDFLSVQQYQVKSHQEQN